MDEAHAYAQAVYAATDSYLESMTDADLNTKRDLTSFGYGTPTVSEILSVLVLNLFAHSGEIFAIKGLRGLKGYPQ